jgi:hypothetical protein
MCRAEANPRRLAQKRKLTLVGADPMRTRTAVKLGHTECQGAGDEAFCFDFGSL